MNMAIKFAGIGGQGIQLVGKLLGDAAFRQGLNVSQGTVYEPSTSGGLTVADIILAPKNQEIYYPFIEKPDVLVLFAQRGWDEFKSQIHDNCIIVADYSNVGNCEGPEREKAKMIFHLPFSTKAREIGSEKVTNVVVLGFIAEMLDIEKNHIPQLLSTAKPEDAEEYHLLEVEPQHFEESLIKASPKKFREMNIEAFKTGYNMSLNQDYSKMGIKH